MVWISSGITLVIVFIMSMIMERLVVNGREKGKNSDMLSGVTILVAMMANGIVSYLLCRNGFITFATVICSLLIMSGAHQYIRK